MKNYQIKRYKYCEDVNLGANANYDPMLSRNFFMRNLELNVRAIINVAGFAAGDVYAEDAHMKLLNRVQMYNGLDTFINLSGRALGHLNGIWAGVAPDFFETPLADGDMTIEFTYHIPFGDELSRKELETYIKSWGYNLLQLKCNVFNDPAEIITTAAGVLTTVGVEIRVYGDVIDLDTAARNASAEKNFLIRRLIEQPETYLDIINYPHDFRNSQLERDKITRALYLITDDDVVGKYGVRSDDLLTDLSLYLNGTDILPQIDEAYLRFWNTRERHYNFPEGVYYIDCDAEGDHLGLPEPSTEQDFYLRYGSNAPAVVGDTARLIVVQDEFAKAQYVK
jgi:hypothetical protein